MIITSVRMLLLLTLVTGLLYPLAITGLAQLLFPRQAAGSLIVEEDTVAGSELIGRQFDDPRYFWGRPSATQPFPYNAAASSGSNYGPLHPDLQRRIEERRQALLAADPGNPLPIPLDLLTASASGLDPHVSPAGASYQAARVARLRGLTLERVEALIERHIGPRRLGFLGQPVVNVVMLNRELDRQ